MPYKSFAYFLGLLIFPALLFSQEILINELMSANQSMITDEDGDYSDWIELYNNDTVNINLHNYYLSDDPAEFDKWTFPNVSIEPGGYFLLFASDKYSTDRIIHIETIVDWGDDWKYFIGYAEPPTGWRSIDFDDSAWSCGASGFGFGDDDNSTNVGPDDPFAAPPTSIFIRKTFTVEADMVKGMILHIDYDDGFVAFLNGTEIARANIGSTGGLPSYNTFTTTAHEAQIYKGGQPDEFRIKDFSALLLDGDNVLAIQVHNEQLYSSDMTLIPFLTLEMNDIPIDARGVAPILGLDEPYLHTNFKISSSGEQLILCDAQGHMVDSVGFGAIPTDFSYGRRRDSGDTWCIFNNSTPGTANSTTAFLGQVEEPQIDIESGFYSGSIEISIESPTGASSYYSLDGAVPTLSSTHYTNPFTIDSTCVLRVRSFRDGYLASSILTRTYLINMDFTLPVVSLVTDPGNFFDTDTGIYVYGPDADTVNYPYWGSNFWEDWERPVHLDFFESDGTVGFTLDTGVKIYGSWSRLFPQKSLAIFARDSYGTDAIEYPIFPDLPIDTYQALILRNAGQDWGFAHFRDMMIHALAASATDLDVQAGRPVIVLLNGQNWGIYNLREKINEHYIASHHDVDSDEIDMIEQDTEVVHGDLVHYQALLDFINENDLSVAGNYKFVQTLIEEDNFLDYVAVELFLGNSDWPWNNVKIWRPRTEEGRWRWILFDTDYGFHGGHYSASTNTFQEMAGDDNYTELLFSKLMENETCRNKFINRYADLLNTFFSPDSIIQKIDYWKNMITPDMPYQIQKWQGSFSGPWWLGKSIDSMDEWYENIQVVVEFANNRSSNVRQHIIDEFDLPGDDTVTVKLDVSSQEAGDVKINTIIPDVYPWEGRYFSSVPVCLTAIPKTGYRFAGWNGIEADAITIEVNCTNNQEISALFVEDSTTINNGMVVINEINYNSETSFNPEDWIELFNPGTVAIDLSDWIFKDSEDTHIFKIPSETILSSKEYLLVCRDTLAFKNVFPDLYEIVGDFSFGLSSLGELLRLYDTAGNLIDSVRYGTESPWPTEPNGNGATLALTEAITDNALPENWFAALEHGTPGKANSAADIDNSNYQQLPTTYSLRQNFPNPFNARTVIQFELPQTSQVSLVIYDLRGKEIIALVDCEMESGKYRIIWNGRDKQGNLVSSGIYLCFLKTQEYRMTKKMVFLR